LELKVLTTAILSIFVTLVLAIVGVRTSPPSHDIKVFNANLPSSPFTAILSMSNIVFAFSGHVSFFTIISEMPKPRDFAKTLYTVQIVDTVIYIVASVAIYHFAGAAAKIPTSPIIFTGEVIKRVIYGLALPTVSSLPLPTSPIIWQTVVASQRHQNPFNPPDSKLTP
jgi:hypothetical protein